MVAITDVDPGTQRVHCGRASANLRSSFDEQCSPPSPSQIGGTNQAVVARADDNRVEIRSSHWERVVGLFWLSRAESKGNERYPLREERDASSLSSCLRIAISTGYVRRILPDLSASRRCCSCRLVPSSNMGRICPSTLTFWWPKQWQKQQSRPLVTSTMCGFCRRWPTRSQMSTHGQLERST